MKGTLALEALNATIALGVLGLGVYVVLRARQVRRRRALGMFAAAACLFAVRELLALASALRPGFEFTELAEELIETVLISFAAAAMLGMAYSQRHEIDALEHRAEFDALTGLRNAAAFRIAARQWLAQARRDGQPASLLLIDADRFKAYNDRFGHEAGNAALQAIAAALQRTSREGDLIARYGGEEFVALLHADAAHAATTAERLRDAVQAHGTPAHNAALRGAVTVSIGVAQLEPAMTGIGPWIEAADRELYRAKAAGRNCVYLAAATAPPPTAARQALPEETADG